MAEKELVAIVTGANKGIGKAIVERLAARFEGSYLAQTTGASSLLIYLTARDESRGLAALQEVRNTAPASVKIEFHPLDINSTESIHALAKSMKERHGQIDVLINNAAVATKGPAFDEQIVEFTLAPNYYGTKEMCLAFLPLLNPTHGRLINVSSMGGVLSRLSSPDLAARFRNARAVPEVDALMAEFRADVKAGTWKEKGWYGSAYATSKMGVTALTRALAHQTRDKNGLLVNAVCPGWVKTDMAGPSAPKTVEEGAVNPVMLALDDIKGKSGTFWNDSGEYEW
ncbi:NAD P-binding protein [Gloeophyllum trabeum ATCC 11539]|uniref:NAD P-binding protein n=1 Tax=Gloeophyllum trabeum (strain ATCC 11539 / FP-39264 / Madison 617) TaxID=670483 RepID=S7QEH1_GLOTA|nr:NAD P-binding protein [Gloeophyllum trabeum ATCC 11539]EPQ57827.1 NAD P-binding protein [Gloeophyllum trabeum ATCC 11539]